MQIMQTKHTHILARLVLLLMAFLAMSIHNRLIAQTGCSLIDKQRPGQFIDYAGVSESFREVKLRLRNNTNCTIIVETDDHYPNRIVKQPNGGIELETVIGSEDGIRLDLHYLILNRRQRMIKSWIWDSVFTYKIPAGHSVFFNVPLAFFKKQLDVAVPFNYSWEGDGIGTGVDGTVHRVYFLFDDLPENLLLTARSNNSFNRTRN